MPTPTQPDARVHPLCTDTRPLTVLIHRVGSLGDTLIAIPALRLIAAAYPNAKRVLLSNVPTTGLAQPAANVLDGLGLISDAIYYESRGALSAAWNVMKAVRAAKPDVVVSLSPRRGWSVALRDTLLFKLAGVAHLHGLGLRQRGLRVIDANTGLHEPEAHRLVRLLRRLGTVDWVAAEPWRIFPSARDRQQVETSVPGWQWNANDLCIAVGTKFPANDWGQQRWLELIYLLAPLAATHRLVCVGLREDQVRSDALLAAWPGRTVNLCGYLSVRATAAVLASARLLVGHDSGPIHLAAAVGTPVVAIFSRRNVLGEWFPLGSQHAIHYTQVACAGCGLAVCEQYQNRCTSSIAAEQIAIEVRARLQ